MQNLIKKETLHILSLSKDDIENIFKAKLDTTYFDKFVNDKKIGRYLIDNSLFNLLEEYLKNIESFSVAEKDELKKYIEDLKQLINITFKY